MDAQVDVLRKHAQQMQYFSDRRFHFEDDTASMDMWLSMGTLCLLRRQSGDILTLEIGTDGATEGDLSIFPAIYDVVLGQKINVPGQLLANCYNVLTLSIDDTWRDRISYVMATNSSTRAFVRQLVDYLEDRSWECFQKTLMTYSGPRRDAIVEKYRVRGALVSRAADRLADCLYHYELQRALAINSVVRQFPKQVAMMVKAYVE